MEKHAVHVFFVIVFSALVTFILARYVVDGARWWNLVMALLLLLALIAYLWQQHNRRDE